MARPTKRTPEIEAKLEHAFSLGSTIVDACYHADIGESTFYDWASNDSKFSERMKALRSKPILKALKTIVDDLGNVNTAKWYLEKKHPDFKAKQDLNVSGGKLQIAGDLLYKRGAEYESNR